MRGDVLCVDGRIAALGEAAAAEEAESVDCSGQYLIPGLIDCHVHVSSSGDPAELTPGQRLPLARRAWRTAEHARATLAGGITTVRDLGAADRLNVALAAAIEAGELEGPRVVAAGMGVTMSGGHGHGFIAREADGPDEVRKAVREEIREGAAAIKLFASGGVLTPGVNPRSPSFTREELTAGVEEATKAFRTVAAHAQSTVGIKNAVAAGVTSIEHGVWLDEEAITMMIERGTYLVATLTAPYHIAEGAEGGRPGLRSGEGAGGAGGPHRELRARHWRGGTRRDGHGPGNAVEPSRGKRAGSGAHGRARPLRGGGAAGGHRLGSGPAGTG